MSSPIWTPAALSSETHPFRGRGWRLVEAQHRVSTLKLVDTLAEQALLEQVLEETKPRLPPECRGLDYLLSTPFRYAPYPQGSRFRRAGRTPGVWYGAQTPETAVAEMVFYRLLFLAESPATPFPANSADYTGFAVDLAGGMVDLTAPPLSRDAAEWRDPVDYAACQTLADSARAAGVQVIRYASVRDPGGGCNLAVLTCAAFAATEPDMRQTWRIRLGRQGAVALREHPALGLEFARDAFDDPRLAGMNWDR
ncbi:MAG: RES family NAD+ phosphorylase [Pseudomonadota bacterium]